MNMKGTDAEKSLQIYAKSDILIGKTDVIRIKLEYGWTYYLYKIYDMRNQRACKFCSDFFSCRKNPYMEQAKICYLYIAPLN